VRSNLFALSDTSTVGINWENVGRGPLGVDLVPLVLGSVRRGEAAAHHHLVAPHSRRSPDGVMRGRLGPPRQQPAVCCLERALGTQPTLAQAKSTE
jgi:hypothetical protein